LTLADAPIQSRQVAADALRHDADTLSSALPRLMAEAERLAATIVLGLHGRRRAGHGENFWQYRRAMPGDTLGAIDWRRSARSDRLYVRETEWEVAQTVSFWVDQSAAMTYCSSGKLQSKGTRAALLSLAAAVALTRGGEKIALLGGPVETPKRGARQLEAMAQELSHPTTSADFGAPPLTRFAQGSRAVFASDFLGPRDNLIQQVGQAADQGVKGCLLHILDPAEESFPFDGRVRFTSMGGGVRYETDRARALKPAYQDKLAERKDALRELARRTGWLYLHHLTSEPPRVALLWLYAALEGFRQ